MVLDASLLITQHYKVRIKGAIKGKELRPFLHLDVVDIEKVAFGSPSTTVTRLNLSLAKRSMDFRCRALDI